MAREREKGFDMHTAYILLFLAIYIFHFLPSALGCIINEICDAKMTLEGIMGAISVVLGWTGLGLIFRVRHTSQTQARSR